MTLSKMGGVLPEDMASWRGQQFITEYSVDLHMIGHFEPIQADEVKELTPVIMPEAALPQLSQTSALPIPFRPSLVSTPSVAAGSLRLTILDADADLPVPLGPPPARPEPRLAARELKEKRVTFDASLETEVHFAYAMAITEKAKKQLDRLDKKISANTQSRMKLHKADGDTTGLLIKEANYRAEKLQLAYETASYLGDIICAYAERSSDLIKPAKRNLLAFIDSVIVQGNEMHTSWQQNPSLHDAQKPALSGLHQKLGILIQQAERLHFADQAVNLRQLQHRIQAVMAELGIVEPPAPPVGIAYSPDKRYLVRDVEGQKYICFCKENGEIHPLTITKADVTSGITTDNYVDFSNAVRQNEFPKNSTLTAAKMLETAEIILAAAEIDLGQLADHLLPKQKIILAFMVAEGGIHPGKVRAVIGRYSSAPSKFPGLIDKLYNRYRQHQASANTLASKFPRSFIGTPERRAALAYEVSKHGAVLTNAVFKTNDFDPYYPEVDGALHTLYAQKTANTGWFVKFLSFIKAGAFAVITTVGSAAVGAIVTGILAGSAAIPGLNIVVIGAAILAGAVLLGVGLYYFIRYLKRKYL